MKVLELPLDAVLDDFNERLDVPTARGACVALRERKLAGADGSPCARRERCAGAGRFAPIRIGAPRVRLHVRGLALGFVARCEAFVALRRSQDPTLRRGGLPDEAFPITSPFCSSNVETSLA